MIAFKNS
jgi:hypothetical protein